jgi:hypothetical protein
VVPDFPLQSVTFRFGHINAPNGPDPHSNIGVNGDLREVVGSIAGMSGQIIGDPATGEAEVIVTLDAVQPANTIVGTVELRAVQRSDRGVHLRRSSVLRRRSLHEEVSPRAEAEELGRLRLHAGGRRWVTAP